MKPYMGWMVSAIRLVCYRCWSHMSDDVVLKNVPLRFSASFIIANTAIRNHKHVVEKTVEWVDGVPYSTEVGVPCSKFCQICYGVRKTAKWACTMEDWVPCLSFSAQIPHKYHWYVRTILPKISVLSCRDVTYVVYETRNKSDYI